MSSKIEMLDFWTCLFLDPPTERFQPNTVLNTTEENFDYILYECFAYGKYCLEDINSKKIITGHSICVLMFIITVLTGSFGIITNILNLIILQKSHKETSVKKLLNILAVVDLVTCVSGIMFSYTIISILENLNRGKGAYQGFRIASITFALSRTVSIYVTMLATIERYIVVRFPYKAQIWLSPLKSCLYLVTVGALSVFLNLSLILNPAVWKVNSNDIFPPNAHAENFPYIFKDTHFTNRDVHDILVFLNYVAPLPLYLLFNGLLLKSIYTWKQRRTRIGGHKQEVNIAKMFSVIVVIALCCHTVACIIFFVSRFEGLIYRELIMTQLFCVVLGSSVNFIVYYASGKNFRVEVHKNIQLINKFCYSSGVPTLE